jgi:hypothetical protein
MTHCILIIDGSGDVRVWQRGRLCRIIEKPSLKRLEFLRHQKLGISKNPSVHLYSGGHLPVNSPR